MSKEILKRKFNLGHGHLGNGITVWNKAKEVHDDYEKIAHISSDRSIKYYVNNLPSHVIDYVEKIAKGPNLRVSSTQPYLKVFNN